jgi:hypothetical protein
LNKASVALDTLRKDAFKPHRSKRDAYTLAPKYLGMERSFSGAWRSRLERYDYYSFRVRHRRWIEVLVRLARERESLHWVTQGGYEISASGYHYGRLLFMKTGGCPVLVKTGRLSRKCTWSLSRIGSLTTSYWPRSGLLRSTTQSPQKRVRSTAIVVLKVRVAKRPHSISCKAGPDAVKQGGRRPSDQSKVNPSAYVLNLRLILNLVAHSRPR